MLPVVLSGFKTCDHVEIAHPVVRTQVLNAVWWALPQHLWVCYMFDFELAFGCDVFRYLFLLPPFPRPHPFLHSPIRGHNRHIQKLWSEQRQQSKKTNNVKVARRAEHQSAAEACMPYPWHMEKKKWRKWVWGQAELHSENLPPANKKDVRMFFQAGNGKVLKTDARATEGNLRKVIVWILVLFTFNCSRKSWCFKSKQNMYFQSSPSHRIQRPRMSWIWTLACSE